MSIFFKNCKSYYFRCIRNELSFGLYKRSYSYESDGKTTVTFLSKESEHNLLIRSFSQVGFRLNSGIFIFGPVIMFPRTLLSWNVADDDDINEDSLSLFCNLEPKVDILVIGLSDTQNSFKNQTKYFEKILELRKMKLNFEMLPTESAISAYNFLISENRFVAAAMIPPKTLDFSSYNFHKFVNVEKAMKTTVLGMSSLKDLNYKLKEIKEEFTSNNKDTDSKETKT